MSRRSAAGAVAAAASTLFLEYPAAGAVAGAGSTLLLERSVVYCGTR